MILSNRTVKFTEQRSEIDADLPSAREQTRLVIVGGGMSGFGLCDRLVRTGITDNFDVTLIGEEPTPAYDRVNLSKYFTGWSAEDLLLAPRRWYAKHNITLRTGARIVRIDRERRRVMEDSGAEHFYDKLVLATGSRAYVPPIPGNDSEGVFVYRTIGDLQAIREYCELRAASRGAVIGGGLLGLEAAKILLDLGLSVSVIEMAPGLMPRQLDADASRLLERHVQSLGVDVQLVRRTESIRREGDKLVIHFANADPQSVDILIIAAGVRPNDQLARDADLKVGPRGGIVVDEFLQTSDPDVFAIGECVSFDDHLFGLVGPCYRMSDVLASRLAGQQATFEGSDESAELKLLGVQVATLGKTIGESPGGNIVTYENANSHRKLLVERGRIVGASCVGSWAELPQIRQAVIRQSRLWYWQRHRFEKTGTPWAPSGALPVRQWPGHAIVCSCLSVNRATITKLIGDGKRDADAIASACGASTACGSCRNLVCELVGAEGNPGGVPFAKTMLMASCSAALLISAWLIIGPIPFAESVQSSLYAAQNALHSDLGRQVTGFGLLGLTLLGLVFSLRKRFRWFQLGSYGFWRAVHGVLGTVVILGLVVHTGMHLGSNLNLMLSVCFLSVAFVGGLAGIISSMESQFTGVLGMWTRLWRPRLTKLHLWITWPLPILIGLHILSFYWFSD